MLADPMVGYWCRVGSLALTHTHNDVAILVQRRTLLSIFLLSRPPPVAPRLLAVFHPCLCGTCRDQNSWLRFSPCEAHRLQMLTLLWIFLFA